MNIIFMVINSLLIPMMSLNSMGLFVKVVSQTPVGMWNTMLGASFLSCSGSFAIRYLANCSLLSSAMQLLQIPQGIHSWFYGNLAVTDTEKRAAATRWDFDFGYWYACVLSICFMCLTFSAVVPLLLPCGTIFFSLKFYVDRHNFQ